MKKLEFTQMQNITATGPGQDFVGGIMCGLGIAAAVGSGGLGWFMAVVGCGIGFGDWQNIAKQQNAKF